MSKSSSIFKTPEGQAKYLAAYDATLALWPVPYESLDVPTRFGSTHIIISGPKDAPPLVLLHGANDSATAWYPNIADLSRNYRTYALDTIGDVGKSVASHLPQSGSDYVDWLTEMHNELKIEQAHVVGLSYGGWLTMNLVLYAPDRVKRIVLLSPAAVFVPIKLQLYIRFIFSAIFPIRPLIINNYLWLSAKGYELNERYVEQVVMSTKHCRPKMVSLDVFSDDELRQINTPTLLLIADQEVIYNPESAVYRAIRLMPNIDIKIISDAGHGMSMDQTEIVNKCILNLLNK